MAARGRRSLKNRALANPLGLLLIGAGIGWRLYRHPPVATLLVGTGIAMLMKGDSGRRLDASAYRDPYDPAQPRGYVPGGVAGYGYPVEDSPPGLADRASAAISHAGYAAEDVKARALDTAHTSPSAYPGQPTRLPIGRPGRLTRSASGCPIRLMRLLTACPERPTRSPSACRTRRRRPRIPPSARPGRRERRSAMQQAQPGRQ